MGVYDLIREYGEITGRSPGWEKYMSVADFIEFKKAAAQIAPEVRTESSVKNEYQNSTLNNTHQAVQPAQTNQTMARPTMPETPTATEMSLTNKQKSQTQPQTTQNVSRAEESELDIFKAMGE